MPKSKNHYIEICYTCINDCISCPIDKDIENKIMPFEEIKNYIDNKVKVGSTVALSGGEPTIHPDFIKIVKYAAKSGAKVSLLSNGRNLQRKGFTQSVVEAGVRHVYIPLHGPNQRIHDRITRSNNSFKETIKGVENLFRLKADGYPLSIYLKTFVCGITIQHLPETVSFMSRNFPPADRLFIEAMHVVNNAWINRKDILIRLTDAVPEIIKAVNLAITNHQGVILRCIPPCIFPEPEFYSKLILPSGNGKRNIYGPIRKVCENIDGAMVKSAFCKECQIARFCGGVWDSYARNIGLDEFKPIKILKPPQWLKK